MIFTETWFNSTIPNAIKLPGYIILRADTPATDTGEIWGALGVMLVTAYLMIQLFYIIIILIVEVHNLLHIPLIFHVYSKDILTCLMCFKRNTTLFT